MACNSTTVYLDYSTDVSLHRILDSVQESFAIHLFYFYLIDNFGNASALLLEVW